MIYTPAEYSATFTFAGVHLSPRSIRRRCETGMLPAGHVAHRKKGFWVIEVQKFPEALLKNFSVNLKLKAPRQL
jgi:hypothetical protein